MKKLIGQACILASSLSLYGAPREPHRTFIEKQQKMKRGRGIEAESSSAPKTMKRSHNEIETNDTITGTILMPTRGTTHAKGTRFSYKADAKTGTVRVTFDDVSSPAIDVTARNLDSNLRVRIFQQTSDSVIFFIEDFSADVPTVLEFQAQ